MLAATNFFLASQLSRMADTLRDETDIVSRLKTANAANRAFGDLKYWLTDLSVSLLMRSEVKAAEARARLDIELDRLGEFDPESSAIIAKEVDGLEKQMNFAVDAYTDDERVLGNSLMAGARINVDKIGRELASLVNRLESDALNMSNHMLDSAKDTVTISNWFVAGASIFGLLLTVFILRSITLPMRKLVASMSEITRGNLEVEIPPETHDETGMMTKTLRMFRDGLLERERLASERELAQQALEHAQTQLTEAIETISEAFVLFDPEDRLILCNEKYRQLYAGLHVGVEAGMYYPDLCRTVVESGGILLGDDSAEGWLQKRIKRHHELPGPYEYELADGRWMRVSERKTHDDCIVGVFTDISDLKSREAELAEMVVSLEKARDQAMDATQAKSRFLANMSHELRTPLNAIIGYSEMLEEDAQERGDNDTVADLKKIHTSGRHLLALINEILDLSKIEVGKMELFLEDIELSMLLDDIINTINPVLEKQHNKLKIDIADDLGVIHTDQTKLRQILLNLLSNAAKFTRRGEVGLTAQSAMKDGSSWLSIAVSDTGIGMTEEQKSRIFDEFLQADASTTRKYGGSGLGLSISRRFCEMLGGSIKVSSTPDVGSTFTIQLPVSSVDATSTPEVALKDQMPDSSGACKVLVIDDDPTVRDLISRYLAKEGYQVKSANAGMEGLSLAKQFRPDVISLDVLMPGMDGWSVLSHLKEDADTADTPVVMISIIDEKKVGYTLGAADFLTKPVDRQQLIRVMDKHCRGQLKGPVLVVEDDKSARELIRKMLAREEIEVAQAMNGQDALRFLEQMQPQIILLDLMMPVMDGFEFLETLKTRPEWQAIPVVVITAKELSSQDHERLNGKVKAVLGKGQYAEDDLLRSLRQAIRRISGCHETVDEL